MKITLDKAKIYKRVMVGHFDKHQVCLEKGSSELVTGNCSSSHFYICSQNRMTGWWIDWNWSRKISTCLILLMFLQIYPPQCTWAVSTVSMQDCSMCTAHCSIDGCFCWGLNVFLHLPKAWRLPFWVIWHFASRQIVKCQIWILTLTSVLAPDVS